MPEFVKPYSGMVPARKMTDAELVRALRLNLSAEEEATHLYMSHADATDNPVAKAVLIDIANEERVHVGEFARLIQLLTGDEDDFLAKGTAEVDAWAAKVSGQPAVAPQEKSPSTIGSMK